MTAKPMKIPGPDHPISIEPNRSRVVVKVGGKIIADTSSALTLREASYPPVQYIPRRDVDMAALIRSDHTSYCPYKGQASYYSIPAGWRSLAQRRVDVRDPVRGDGADQGIRRVLPRPCRRDRLTCPG